MCSLYRIFCTSLSISLYLHKASSCVLLAKLCCDSGHDPQTATFPRMPSVTDFQVCYHGLALGSRVHRVGKNCFWISLFVPFTCPLLVSREFSMSIRINTLTSLTIGQIRTDKPDLFCRYFTN